jgi:alpha-tubulin suppressor-like RCC1 family protein
VKVYGEDSLNNEWGYSSTAKATIGGTEYTSSSGSLHTFSQTGALTKVTIVNNSGTGRTYMEGIGVDDHLLVDSGVLYPDKVSSPVQIPGNWSKLDNGNYSTGGGVAIRNNKTLWGWGYNDKGALGQNNRTTYSSPVQIPGEYSNVSWSYRSMGAVKTDGTLWAWGNNAQGQLGQNDVVLHSSPVQIGGDTTWGQTRHSLFNNDQFAAVKTDGTLWSWGSNTSGQLGHNQAEAQLAGASSPTQIPGTTWSKVSGGNQCFYATKTDNTLWAWGKNNFGQLGNNNIISHSSPVQIPGTTWNITEVSNSVAVISAFKTDGTLWGWGHNINGALGQNQAPAQLAGYSSPVQLSGTTWNQIATYDDGGRLATRSDGTAWTWGYNGNGGLGLNNTTSYSSPTQLPGTDWTGDITGKSTSFFALRTS